MMFGPREIALPQRRSQNGTAVPPQALFSDALHAPAIDALEQGWIGGEQPMHSSHPLALFRGRHSDTQRLASSGGASASASALRGTRCRSANQASPVSKA